MEGYIYTHFDLYAISKGPCHYIEVYDITLLQSTNQESDQGLLTELY